MKMTIKPVATQVLRQGQLLSGILPTEGLDFLGWVMRMWMDAGMGE